eukprot:snap_masked-scaffold_3-processed-gene-8.23-mRNA-1 protein AED:1.00 eAED:1.00 QI:0/-1/0/0/-1/1/1/0/623
MKQLQECSLFSEIVLSSCSSWITVKVKLIVRFIIFLASVIKTIFFRKDSRVLVQKFNKKAISTLKRRNIRKELLLGIKRYKLLSELYKKYKIISKLRKFPRNDSVRQDSWDFRDTLRGLRNENEELRQEKNNLVGEAQRLSTTLHKYKLKVRSLDSKFVAQDTDIATLNRCNETIQQEKKKMEHEINLLQVSKSSKEEKTSFLEQKLFRKTMHVELCKRFAYQKEIQLSQTVRSFEKLKTELQEECRKNLIFSEALSKQTVFVEQLEKTVLQQNKKLDSFGRVEEEFIRLQGNFDSEMTKNKSMEREIYRQQEDIANMKREQASNKMVREHLNMIVEDLSCRLLAKNEVIISSNKRGTDLQLQHSSLRTELFEYKAKANLFTKELESKQNEVETLQASMEDLLGWCNHIVVEAQEENNGLLLKVDVISDQLEKLQQKYAEESKEQSSQIESANSIIRDLRKRNRLLNSVIKEKERSCEILLTKQSANEKRMKELETRFQLLSSENNQALLELKATAEQLESKEKQLTWLKRENKELQSIMNEKNHVRTLEDGRTLSSPGFEEAKRSLRRCVKSASMRIHRDSTLCRELGLDLEPIQEPATLQESLEKFKENLRNQVQKLSAYK